MPLLKAKQIDKVISAPVFITNLPALGGTFEILESTIPGDEKTYLSDALATAANNGGSVFDQSSPDPFTPGVISSGAYNRVEIFDSATSDKLTSASGQEVYGRLLGTSGDYYINSYTNESGTETAFDLPAGNLDFVINYRFEFKDLPADAAFAVQGRYVSDDAAGLKRTRISEVLSVTGIDTLSDLSARPADSSDLKLIVNNRVHSVLTGAFSLVSTALTWNASTAGYSLETTDDVVAEYTVFS